MSKTSPKQFFVLLAICSLFLLIFWLCDLNSLSLLQHTGTALFGLVISIYFIRLGYKSGEKNGFQKGWRAAFATQLLPYNDRENGLIVGGVYETLISFERQEKGGGRDYFINVVREESGSTHLIRCVRSNPRALPKLFRFSEEYCAEEVKIFTQ